MKTILFIMLLSIGFVYYDKQGKTKPCHKNTHLKNENKQGKNFIPMDLMIYVPWVDPKIVKKEENC